MKTWLLIIILSGTGKHVEVVEEYRAKAYCQEAAQVIERGLSAGVARQTTALCVPGEL